MAATRNRWRPAAITRLAPMPPCSVGSADGIVPMDLSLFMFSSLGSRFARPVRRFTAPDNGAHRQEISGPVALA